MQVSGAASTPGSGVFDNKLARRMSGEYAEQYTHSADSTGIHASGAGFERSDFAGVWQPPEGY